MTHKENASSGWSRRGEQEQKCKDHQFSGMAAPLQMSGKTFATLQAIAAMRGYELLALSDGSFLVGRWGRTRSFLTLAGAEAGLAQMGVHHG